MFCQYGLNVRNLYACGTLADINIEMYLLLIAFDLAAFVVDCVLSRTVMLLLTFDLVACVLNWCKRILNV